MENPAWPLPFLISGAALATLLWWRRLLRAPSLSVGAMLGTTTGLFFNIVTDALGESTTALRLSVFFGMTWAGALLGWWLRRRTEGDPS